MAEEMTAWEWQEGKMEEDQNALTGSDDKILLSSEKKRLEFRESLKTAWGLKHHPNKKEKYMEPECAKLLSYSPQFRMEKKNIFKTVTMISPELEDKNTSADWIKTRKKKKKMPEKPFKQMVAI